MQVASLIPSPPPKLQSFSNNGFLGTLNPRATRAEPPLGLHDLPTGLRIRGSEIQHII